MTISDAGRAERARALAELRPELIRIACYLTGDQNRAEDVVQEVLLAVWARLVASGSVENLRAYCISALRNACRGRRPQPAPLPLDVVEETIALQVPAGADSIADVLAAVARLPDEQAALIRRVAIAGQTFREVAAETGLPIGTVMSRVARARQRLRTDLGVEPPPAPRRAA